MRKILVLQHIEIEGLGIIENFFKKSKSDVHYVKLHKNEKIPINLDQFKMMISLEARWTHGWKTIILG